MTLPILVENDSGEGSHPSTAEHLRYEIAQLEKLRKQIFSDMEAMRAQETNLREYESRLRDGAGAKSRSPIAKGQASGIVRTASTSAGSEEELNAAWEKFHRAHALLEAERRALCDERIALREERDSLRKQDEEVKRRETWVAQREAELKAANAKPANRKKAFTDAPFAAAKEMFSISRKKTTTTTAA